MANIQFVTAVIYDSGFYISVHIKKDLLRLYYALCAFLELLKCIRMAVTQLS